MLKVFAVLKKDQSAGQRIFEEDFIYLVLDS
jgi:hypothetical protein